MYLAYILAKLQAEQVAEKALETSPYNAVAYGVLVAILILALVFLWREYKNVLQRHRDYIEKTVGLVQMVESKLESVDDLEREISDLNGKVSSLREKVSKLSEYINLLRSDEPN